MVEWKIVEQFCGINKEPYYADMICSAVFCYIRLSCGIKYDDKSELTEAVINSGD